MAGYGKILECELSISAHEVGEEARLLENSSRPKTGSPRNTIIGVVVVVQCYCFLIIIIVVGPGAWLSHSAAEGYRFLSKVVATLARNADPPRGLRGCLCFPPPKKSNSVQ